MALASIKQEHTGHWTRFSTWCNRAEAKRASRKIRRHDDKVAVQNAFEIEQEDYDAAMEFLLDFDNPAERCDPYWFIDDLVTNDEMYNLFWGI